MDDLSLEQPALNAVIPGMARPGSSRGRPPSASRGPPGGANAGQDRMHAVRDLQEENAKLREKLADIQVRRPCPPATPSTP
eukprot:708287-Prorocentrum_minimum.AAC.4